MELDQYEATVNDLEGKVERLRILYEQWFQGIERLEPLVARKDVDRRMYVMRKEQVRNTALRFRFQQLVLKFTQLVAYWQRTARQIEDGTYRRDLLKMRRARENQRAGYGVGAGASIDIDVEVDSLDGLAEADIDAALADLDEQPTGPIEATEVGRKSARPPASNRPAGSNRPPARKGPAPLSAFAAKQASGQSAAPDEELEREPTNVNRAAATPSPTERMAGAQPDAKAPSAGAQPTGTFLRPREQAAGGPATFGRPKRDSENAAQNARGAAGPGAVKLAQPAATAPTAPKVPAAAPKATPAATSSSPHEASGRMSRLPAPPPKPGQTGVKPPTATPPGGLLRPPPATPVGGVARPAAPAQVPASGARPPVPAPPPPRPSAGNGKDLSDDQIRVVYERYLEARRKNNERTDNVKFETVKKSLREMAPKLQEKHAGKKIDFEVVVKDGKVGIKPVAKG